MKELRTETSKTIDVLHEYIRGTSSFTNRKNSAENPPLKNRFKEYLSIHQSMQYSSNLD